jgi:hypothetical protein
MTKSWIALRVEDFQSVLDIIFSLLSTMGIFDFARFRW